ncbi:hypothetical protein [Gloeobacter morelensis]|uniref:Uncharacterized protein n=1 Tax=Gloeobacter morelensis MG652769 TaxID=2781736 RepID=A0ABY3PR89_9CYAN|nr:hypothetical protein [Gloeobacter morelensis]UFP96180.1 hypothetical protein ISF26_08230 [Gloeobacter morelensis MG652769]
MAEVGLAIGCGRGVYQGIEREWLYWYDQAGERYLTPEERAAEAQQQVLQEAAARRQSYCVHAFGSKESSLMPELGGLEVQSIN